MLFTPSRRHTGFDLFDDFFNDPFFTAPVSQPMNTIMRTDVKDDGSNYLLDIELPGQKRQGDPPGALQRFLQEKLLCGRDLKAGGHSRSL